jgi:hypothetical protein
MKKILQKIGQFFVQSKDAVVNVSKKVYNSFIVQLIIKNTLTQISILGAIMILSAIIYGNFDVEWAHTSMIYSMLGLAIIALSYIVFAWIVNPIVALIKKIRKDK